MSDLDVRKAGADTPLVRGEGCPRFFGHAVRQDKDELRHVPSLGRTGAGVWVWVSVAPLPRDVAFNQQQLAALDSSVCLDLSEEEMADLGARIRFALAEKA